MRKHYLALLFPFIFACQLSGVLEPTPAPTSAPEPLEIDTNVTAEMTEAVIGLIDNRPMLGEAVLVPPAIYEPFGVAEPVPVQIPAVVPLYTPNLAQIENLEQFALSDFERQQLEQDGYLKRPNGIGTTADMYSYTGSHMLTVDLIMAYTHAVQREVLNQAADQFSQKQTYDLLNGLIAESQQQLAAANDPLTREAAAKNLAIFNMGGKFYDESWPITPEVADLVETELTLFNSSGQFESPLLGKLVNYESIRQDPLPAVHLFIWFLVGSPTLDSQQSPADQRLAGKQIELLLELWTADAVPAWRFQYLRNRYQSGTEAHSIEQWQALYATGARDDDFVQSAFQLDVPQFSLFPRAQATQQQVFSQLVFNNVGVHESPETAPATAKQESIGTIRAVPRPLDVAAAFGSELALETLKIDGEAGFAGWEPQMVRLQAELGGASGLPATLQRDFLHAIQPLAQAVPASYPAYMRSAGWDPLTQWEVGFLLSTQQIPDFEGQAISIPAGQQVFLEPRPDLYANLAAQTRILAEGLVAQEMLDGPNSERLLALESDLLRLKQIAEKQLAGVAPTPDSVEADLLRSVLFEASQIRFRGEQPVYLGPLGNLTGRFSGYVPTLFIVLNGDQQVVAQGGRLQVVFSRQ